MMDFFSYPDLDETIKHKLFALDQEEFGHIPIVKETEWSDPDYTCILFDKDEILTFFNIITRIISVDGEEMKAGGINNVITPVRHRGNGFAFNALKQLPDIIFRKLDCNLGLLLCADDMIPYYERLDWYKVDVKLWFDQSSEKKQWKSNVMILTQHLSLNPSRIDLNGLPW